MSRLLQRYTFIQVIYFVNLYGCERYPPFDLRHLALVILHPLWSNTGTFALWVPLLGRDSAKVTVTKKNRRKEAKCPDFPLPYPPL